MMPGGGYFGTKKACEPVHVQYSYDDKSIVVVNNTYQPLAKLKVTARIFDINSAEKFSKTISLDLPADKNVQAFVIPEIEELTPTFFLKLTLEDAAGKLVSDNSYWLAAKDDVPDFEKSTWYYTPVQSYADLTQLSSMKPVELRAAGQTTRTGAEETARVTIENPSRDLAFFVRLQIKRGQNGDDVLPVIWEDNYISLLPGEKRELKATYSVKDLHGSAPALTVGGWNVPTKAQAMTASVAR
jgi:exo-1,4-beta-D-glucosaminidase